MLYKTNRKENALWVIKKNGEDISSIFSSKKMAKKKWGQLKENLLKDKYKLKINYIWFAPQAIVTQDPAQAYPDLYTFERA